MSSVSSSSEDLSSGITSFDTPPTISAILSTTTTDTDTDDTTTTGMATPPEPSSSPRSPPPPTFSSNISPPTPSPSPSITLQPLPPSPSPPVSSNQPPPPEPKTDPPSLPALPGDPNTTPPPGPSSSSSSLPPSSSSSASGGNGGGGGGSSISNSSSSSSSQSSNASSSSSANSTSSSASSSDLTTLSETSTSVFTSASLVTSNGQEFTTFVQVTTVIAPGTVVSTPPKAASKENHTGAIVGGVVGGIAGLVLMGGLLFYLLRRKRYMFDKAFDGNFDPDYVAAAASSSAVKKPGGGSHVGVLAHHHPNSLDTGNTNMRQRVNLDDPNALGAGRQTGLEAALAEDDGMGGRLDASTVGGGIVSPFPYSQLPPQGYQAYSNASSAYGQSPYSPPMSTVSPPPHSVSGHGHGYDAGAMGLGAATAGYHGVQQSYNAYGGQQHQQGYPISPASTDGTHSSGGRQPSVYPQVNPAVAAASAAASSNAYPSPANPYLNAGSSTAGHQSSFSAGSATGVAGAFATSSSGSRSEPPAGMSAKEREARGYARGGLGVVNVTEEGEGASGGPGRRGSEAVPLISPYDGIVETPPTSASTSQPSPLSQTHSPVQQASGKALMVHMDGGRLQDEDEGPSEIPPAYESIQYEGGGNATRS